MTLQTVLREDLSNIRLEKVHPFLRRFDMLIPDGFRAETRHDSTARANPNTNAHVNSHTNKYDGSYPMTRHVWNLCPPGNHWRDSSWIRNGPYGDLTLSPRARILLQYLLYICSCCSLCTVMLD